MAKMRVFELARELNIPGKDLITRIKGMGFAVEGNFNVLDEKTIEAIKSKMLEPVTRVEEKAAETSEEEELAEQPRKRRIISARRSEEVQKIQESMGVSGPLPEDAETREEMAGEEPAGRRISARGTPEEGEEAAPPPEAGEAGETPEGEAVAAEGAAPPEGEAAAPAPGEAVAAEGAGAVQETAEARAARGAPPLPVDEDEEEGRAPRRRPPTEKERVRWRELREPGEAPDATEMLDTDPAQWKDVVTPQRPVTPAPPVHAREWVRPTRTRRGGDRGRGRPGRRPAAREGDQKHIFGPRKKAIRIGQQITVSSLAGTLGVKANDIIRKLMALGVMANVNQQIEGSTAELIASEFNIEVTLDTSDVEDLVKVEEVEVGELKPRPPIVTIMGHVDHGKTSLLDYIRSSHITDRETGGITQHIGAYDVKSEHGDIVFLDTPGHEAFTSLRARGADITDLVVLVVAADDGVMPQTVEAIDHARAAEVPILVAMNKIDRPGADPEKIKRQLMEHELLAEEFGGETVLVPVSAVTGEGVPQLLEMIHLQAEIMELKAPDSGRARGFVIESKMDRRRGPAATVIVQRGTLRVGDDFVAGTTIGRVRAMYNDLGDAVEAATPSVPVEVLGSNELPHAGDEFVVVEDEKTARQIAETRQARKQETDGTQVRRMHLEDFIQGVGQQDMTTLNLVVKADTQGSLEALTSSLERQGAENARVEIVRAGVGGITETDVSLAATTNSIVVGFNVRAGAKTEEQAQAEGVEIKRYTVIYDLINEMRDALQGMLKPIVREEIIGHGEVREIFSMSKEGQVAGSYIKDGRLERNALVRLFRDDVLIHTGTINSLRRFKDDVQNVAAGYECGLRLANFTDIRVGDQIEAYINVEETQVLQESGRG